MKHAAVCAMLQPVKTYRALRCSVAFTPKEQSAETNRHCLQRPLSRQGLPGRRRRSMPTNGLLRARRRSSTILAAAASDDCLGGGGELYGCLEPGATVCDGRFAIREVLGRGSNATTYRAVIEDEEAESGTRAEVAIKSLGLAGMTSWKQLQLFEREAATLRSLSHPSIPKYIDYFEEDLPGDRRFYLIQELAPGSSLARLVEEGRRFTEEQVCDIARQLLGVLTYLQEMKPAVIHRDIKPENIVLGGPDGHQVYVVDFGGVQASIVSGESAPLGSTIIGTYGFMAPEQFQGAAQPSSDLYALGGTLLYLLSGGQEPSTFPRTPRLRIQFQRSVSVGKRLERLLEGLLEPLPDDRLTARQALAILDGPLVPDVALASLSSTSFSSISLDEPKALNSVDPNEIFVGKLLRGAVDEAWTRRRPRPNEVLQNQPPLSRITAGYTEDGTLVVEIPAGLQRSTIGLASSGAIAGAAAMELLGLVAAEGTATACGLAAIAPVLMPWVLGISLLVVSHGEICDLFVGLVTATTIKIGRDSWWMQKRSWVFQEEDQEHLRFTDEEASGMTEDLRLSQEEGMSMLVQAGLQDVFPSHFEWQTIKSGGVALRAPDAPWLPWLDQQTLLRKQAIELDAGNQRLTVGELLSLGEKKWLAALLHQHFLLLQQEREDGSRI